MERSHHVEAGSVEASLLQMINDHNHAAIELRERAEKAKKEAIRTAIRVSDLLVKAVNGGVQEIFMNEKRIEAEIRALTATIMRFSKQTDQWLTASHAVNTAVKVSDQIRFYFCVLACRLLYYYRRHYAITARYYTGVS